MEFDFTENEHLHDEESSLNQEEPSLSEDEETTSVEEITFMDEEREDIFDDEPTEELTSEDFAEGLAQLFWELKGENVAILNMDGVADFTDYFVICSAQSPNHLRAIAEQADVIMRDSGIKVRRKEGYKSLKWILLDYGDVIGHIFLPGARDYYALEQYWADCPVRRLNEKGELV
jgi:ribosome-associated protein